MTRITLTVTFVDDDGKTRSKSCSVETSYVSDAEGEQRLTDNLCSEMKVDVGEQAPPKHYSTARAWLNFPNKAVPLSDYFDVTNSQAMWLELCNLILRIEADLAIAQSFKRLEPAEEPALDEQGALDNLHYLHDRKMALLNQAVYGLIKAQDLVNRLLHESIGGDLVDSRQPDWEKYQLNRKNVRKGLDKKLAAGAISQKQHAEVRAALEIPRKHPKAGTSRSYRNRLTHHIRPSVDYPFFFSSLDSRDGEKMRDARGMVIGKKYLIRAQQPPQYAFQDLHAAFSEYLDAVVEMLQKLSEVEILRR